MLKLLAGTLEGLETSAIAMLITTKDQQVRLWKIIGKPCGNVVFVGVFSGYDISLLVWKGDTTSRVTSRLKIIGK